MMSGTGLLPLGITGNCLVVIYIAVAVLHRFFFFVVKDGWFSGYAWSPVNIANAS